MSEFFDYEQINISEIFISIQEIGRNAGSRTVFIRFAGCSIRCNWCNVNYIWDEKNLITLEECWNKISKLLFSKINVCITGGEPLQQKTALQRLLAQMVRKNCFIEIDTSGVIDGRYLRDMFGDRIRFIADLKLPSSGVESDLEWLKNLNIKDDIIAVVENEDDVRCLYEILSKNKFKAIVFIYPVYGNINLFSLYQMTEKYNLWQLGTDIRLGGQFGRDAFGGKTFKKI